MNSPIKDIADKNALIEGILDGTVDMISNRPRNLIVLRRREALKSPTNGA